MKITFKLKMNTKYSIDLPHLNHLMAVFCSTQRYSFNRLLEGETSSELIKINQHKFLLNKRFSEDAVLFGKAVVDSQKKLLPLRLEDVQAKMEKTKNKIDDYSTGRKTPKKVDLETCLISLNARLEKLQSKEEELQSHIDNNTIPKVIFGGKKNFYERMNGNLTKEQWKELRSNTLYSRGDKSKKGNLNIRLGYNEEKDEFYVEIANPLKTATSKTKAPRLIFPVVVPDKYLKRVLDLIMPDNEEYVSYSIEIKRKNDEYTLHVTIDEEDFGEELKWSEDFRSEKRAGIDINIDRIAVSIISKQGNLLRTKVFYCHELEYVRSNQRDNIIGNIMKEVFDWLLSEGVGAVVFEDITLKQRHDTDKKFNRLTHNFTKKN